MKVYCLLLLVGFGCMASGRAEAQVDVYGEFSAARLTDLTGAKTLYGPTAGVVVNMAKLGKVTLDADFRGTFVRSNGVALNGITIGPRLAIKAKRFKPYGEFLLGFARYDNGQNAPASSTTDTDVQLNAGLDYRISKRFDWRVVDYSWGKYLGLGGEFNPRVYSTGIVVHVR